MDISENNVLTESQKLKEPYWEFRRNQLAEEQQAGTLDPELIDQQTGAIESESQLFNNWYLAQKILFEFYS